MKKFAFVLILATLAAPLAGCYVYPVGGPVVVRPAGAVWVPGHYGPYGHWIPGHYV